MSSQNVEKGYISPSDPKLKINKGNLFSQTLKIEENVVSLVFSIFAQELRFSLFLLFCQPRQQAAILKFRKWLYLSPWAKIEKNKDTLFSSTFKVWENKEPLVFFQFWLWGWDIALFSFFVNHINKVLSKILENGYISALSKNLRN